MSFAFFQVQVLKNLMQVALQLQYQNATRP